MGNKIVKASLIKRLTYKRKPDGSIVFKDHTGAEFPSIEAMCAAWKVHRMTVARRLRSGHSLEYALTTKLASREISNIFGENFADTTAMANRYKMPRTTLKKRLKLGWTVEEAIFLPKRACANNPIKPVLFTINGENYQDFQCKICGQHHIFTLAEIRAHYMEHIRQGKMDTYSEPYPI